MSDSPVSIGLDVGTTNTKALAVETATGAVLHTVSHPTPVQSTQDGDFRDAEQTFAVVTSVLTDLIGCLGPSVVSRVICIGVASLGEELFMVDDRGRALELSPAWYNTTLATGVEHIDRTFGWHKLAWNHERMQANGTDTGRARGFTSLGGYIAARLAAHTAHDPILIDHTHASRTGFLHAEDASWDTAVFESTGWEAEMLPQITAPLHDARSIDPDFAEQLGLSMDVSVCSAGHDHLCAGYAVGARLPGTLFLSAGTAEAHLLIVDPDAVAEGIPEGVSVGRYVTDDGVYLHSQIAAGRIYQS